jgi:hypothetical protein
MNIYIYVLKVDSGFAPNPFYGYCTLACCKPNIRKVSNEGDWVIGITPRNRGLGNQIAYAMEIDEKLSFTQYWSDPRFKNKRPVWAPGHPEIERCGDNCYEPLGNDQFQSIPSHHCENKDNKEKDLGGIYVLVGKHFIYFGSHAIQVPSELSFVLDLFKESGIGHRTFNNKDAEKILPFLESLPQGIHGRPQNWPENDTSWQEQ